MPTSFEQNLETWVASRKQTSPADLTHAVMEAIQDETQLISQAALLAKCPSWLAAASCLLAGVAKLSLVFNLVF